MVREDFSRSRCDSLVIDIRAVVENLTKMDKERVDEHVAHGNQRQARRGRQARHHYKNNQKHSLAKHGKTHPIC